MKTASIFSRTKKKSSSSILMPFLLAGLGGSFIILYLAIKKPSMEAKLSENMTLGATQTSYQNPFDFSPQTYQNPFEEDYKN